MSFHQVAGSVCLDTAAAAIAIQHSAALAPSSSEKDGACAALGDSVPQLDALGNSAPRAAQRRDIGS